MKKILLVCSLISAVLLLQNCKKDTVTATATSTQTLFADVNDSTWTPDTLSAAITYNAALKTKVFTISGQADNKLVNTSVTQKTNSNTPGFLLATYNSDAAGTNTFLLSRGYINSGNFSWQPDGTVDAGSGTLVVTAIDSVKKVITGTFSFTSKHVTYDGSGNISTIRVTQVSLGAFNNMPYTFTSN